ncbi:MAG: pyridoxal phosphate-dependent aminotransferase [Schleiferiaceae bacterium]
MAKLSPVVQQLEEPMTIGMSRKSRELAATGINVISLSLGEPDFDTPDFIKEAGKQAIDDNYSHYTPVAGFADLREAVCKKFKRDNGLDYEPNQVLVSTGAKQSLANAIMTLVGPGDEVIIPAPYWVTYYELVKLAGGTPVVLASSVDTNFKVSADRLAAAITEKTTVIMFSSPCNPSGSVYSREELEAWAEVVAAHPNITVLSDEIYELINYTGQHVSFATIPGMYDRTLTINGLSKGFAMTGWRLGYMAGPADIIRACDKVQGQFTSGTCSITQRAAIAALDADPSKVQYMVDTFAKRRELMMNMLGEIPGLKLSSPEGAFYMYPDVSAYFGKSFNGKTLNTSLDISMYLLEEGHVATVPGDAFGTPENIRLSFAASEENLTEAVRRVAEALANLK